MALPASDVHAVAPDPHGVGPYRLVGELGRGGMGVVYRAEDPRLGRDVALKVLPAGLADDPVAKERLLREARAAAAIDHPHVCTVYEVAETHEGRPYIALACYDGETLADRLSRGPLPVEEAVRVGREVASGVAAAHARGVVHRDLKPSNVFICEDGTAKVLDFGIAKADGGALTKTGQTAGTLEYGAPEQARGQVDARSDVWALGVVLYEMLTGRRPFAAPYEAAVLYAVLHEDPSPPSAIADVPPALDAVVMRCLEKDPDARYPDAAVLADVLDNLAEGPKVRQLRVGSGRLGSWGAARVASVIGLVALVAVGLWAARGVEGGPSLPSTVHLAVLPLTARPSGEDHQAFATGLTETLAAGIPELAPPGRDVWVVPVSEVRALEVGSAREAGATLGANLALTGSLHREGGRLTLTLNLITADDRPRTLASRTLTTGGAEEGRIRGRALQAIAEMLAFDLPPEADARLASGSSDPEAQRFYLVGVGYLERNRDAEDLGRAVDLFEEAIGEDSSFAAASARLAEAAVETYRATRDSSWVGRAERAAQRALQLDAAEPLAHVALSRLRQLTGDYPEAVAEAREALALQPGSHNALLALALAQESNGDPGAAEETFREAIRQRPGLWTAYAQLGFLYWRQGAFDDAAEQFEQIVRLAPGNYQGHYYQAAIAQQAGRSETARRGYQTANRIRPTAGAYSNLGLLLTDGGDHTAAAAMFRRAAALDSTDHVIWGNLSAALGRAGTPRAGQAAMSRAFRWASRDLEVNPNDAHLLASRSLYAVGLGRRASALDDIERATSIAPSDVRVSLRAGEVYAYLDEPERAVAALEPAVMSGYQVSYLDTSATFAGVRSGSRWPTLREKAPSNL